MSFEGFPVLLNNIFTVAETGSLTLNDISAITGNEKRKVNRDRKATIAQSHLEGIKRGWVHPNG